jgi:hypothetical protein
VLLIKRLLGALLLAAGLALVVVGGWFAAFLGSNGTARFAVPPTGSTPVLLEPAILNRTAHPVRVTVTPKAGSTATIAIGAPSDAAAVIGDHAVAVVTGADVRAKSATITRRGSASGLDLGLVDVWRTTRSVSAPTTVVVDQADAPQTMIIQPGSGADLGALTLTWSDPAWFREALVAIGVGVILVLAGARTILPRRRRHRAPTTAGDGINQGTVVA